MEKKGFLLGEQVVKIVIALIVLGFLIYFLTALYFSSQKIDNQQQAESFFNGPTGLKNFLENLSDGEAKLFTHPEDIPSGWYLFSFTGEGKRPPVCGNSNCLCVCENVLNFWGTDRQVTRCADTGACIVVRLRPYADELEIELKSDPLTELRVAKNSEGVVSIEKR